MSIRCDWRLRREVGIGCLWFQIRINDETEARILGVFRCDLLRRVRLNMNVNYPLCLFISWQRLVDTNLAKVV